MVSDTISSGWETKQACFEDTLQGIDDCRIEKKLPTESTMYLELALNTLWAHTGVFVDWSTEKEE